MHDASTQDGCARVVAQVRKLGLAVSKDFHHASERQEELLLITIVTCARLHATQVPADVDLLWTALDLAYVLGFADGRAVQAREDLKDLL